MKTVAFTNIFILSAAIALIAQSPASESCPKLWIKTPEAGAYFKRGGTYTLKVWISSFHGTEIKYKWKFPEDLRFTGQGERELTFVADDSIAFRDVNVSVEVDGLPSNCPNTANVSFQVHFNPGSPLIFDEFGTLSAREEFVRIGIMVQQLNKLEGQRALFVIGYGRKESKRSIQRRIQRIESLWS